MATLGGKTLEEMQSEIALLESKLECERQSNSTKVAFKLKKKAPILSSKLDCSIDADRCPVPGKDARTQDEAGDTSSQVLDENTSPATTASMLLDLDKLTDAQILAVQTRAQRRRQELQQQADAAATGAVIHSLEDPPLADRPLGGGNPVNRDGGASTSGSLPADRPGSESTQAEEEDDDTSSVPTLDPVNRDGGASTSGSLPADRPGSESTPTDEEDDDTSSVSTLVEDVTSGEEDENDDKVDRSEPANIITDPFTRSELVKQQKEDDSLKLLFEAARQGDPEYLVKDDVLYGVNLQPKPDETPLKIVVPTPLRDRILQLGHDKSGHFGHKKTRNHILAHFTWPGVGREIQLHCKRCRQCMAFNSHRRDHQPQQVVPVITTPWKKLAMDVVGPLTRTKTGYRYILTVVDLATRYPVAVPLKRVDVQTTCTELVEIFASYGVPEEIVHDNGGNFTAQLMKEVLGVMGIQQIRTSPYHPEANGAIERMHGTLKKALKKAGSKATTWDQWLPYVLYVMRTTEHEATGHSPFRLLFGRQPCRHPHQQSPRNVGGPSGGPSTSGGPVLATTEGQDEDGSGCCRQEGPAQDVAGKRDHEAKLASKAYQDGRKKAEESVLEPGTYVLCLEPKRSRGLSAKWQGPFQVKKRLGLATYLIDVGHNQTRRRHRNALKVYLPEEVNLCSL